MTADPVPEGFLKVAETNYAGFWRLCHLFAPEGKETRLHERILFQVRRTLAEVKTAQSRPGVWRTALNTALAFSARWRGPQRHGAFGEVLEISLAQLDGLEKALLVLHLEALSYSEMAGIMGMRDGDVGVLLHRVKQKLSPLLSAAPPSDEKLRQAWRLLGPPAGTSADRDGLRLRIEAACRRCEHRVRRRNVVEIAAAVILILCFGVYLFLFRLPLAQAGSAIVLVTAALLARHLIRGRRAAKEISLAGPVLPFLRQEQERVEAQTRRLSRVLLRYIAPLMAGLNIFCFGLPRPGAYKFYFLGATVLLSLLVFWLNRRGLTRQNETLATELAAFPSPA